MAVYGVNQLFYFQFRNCRRSNVNSQCMGKMHFDLINAFCLTVWSYIGKLRSIKHYTKNMRQLGPGA